LTALVLPPTDRVRKHHNTLTEAPKFVSMRLEESENEQLTKQWIPKEHLRRIPYPRNNC